MIDLHNIEAFSMTYIFDDGEGDETVYEYEQVGTPHVLPDGKSVRFALKDIDEESGDDEEYLFTLVQTGDEAFSVKSNYFEDPEELYDMNIEVNDDEVCFTSISEGEEMYLYGFFA